MSDHKDTTTEHATVANEARVLDHDYDGIQEFDNSLPSWWLTTFYGGIVFAIGYFAYYGLGQGPTLVEEYEREASKTELASIEKRGKIKHPDEAAMVALFKDPEKQKVGQGVFQVRCASCHGAQGQGLIGPNLTDDYWIHGAKLTEITKTIYEGVGDKGMPAWGLMISPDEVYAAAVFVKSLKGTQPPNPKAPQGNLVKE